MGGQGRDRTPEIDPVTSGFLWEEWQRQQCLGPGSARPRPSCPSSPSSSCLSIRTHTYFPDTPKDTFGLQLHTICLPGKPYTPPTRTRPWPQAQGIPHGVQKRRTFPDGKAWVEGPAPLCQGAGSCTGSERETKALGLFSGGKAKGTGSDGLLG